MQSSAGMFLKKRTSRPQQKSSYEFLSRNNFNTLLEMEYGGCWHQTCPKIDTHKKNATRPVQNIDAL